MFVATTTVTLRPPAVVETDKLGDTVAGHTGGPPVECVRAHLAEKRATVGDDVSTGQSDVTYFRLCLPPGSVLAEGYEVTDEANGDTFRVRKVYGIARQSPVGYDMVRADLERVA